MLAALLSVFLIFPALAQTVPLDVVSGTASDQKPAEEKPAEAKPAEEAPQPAKKPRKKKAKPAAATPAEAQPAEEAKPASSDEKPAAAEASEEKPAPKPAKKRRAKKKPADEPKSVEAAKPAEGTKPAEETKPAEPGKPAEEKPAEEAPKPAKKSRRAKTKAAAAAKAEEAPKAEAKPEPKPAPAPKAEAPKPEPKVEVAASTPIAVTPVLEVIWPKEHDGLPYVARSFTFGHTNPGSMLTVNGQQVQVRPSGAFFAMVPFSTGTFALDYVSRLDGIVVSTRHVVDVAPLRGPEPKPGEVLALEPAEDVEARPGELLVVRCKGAPGGQGTFSVGRVARDLPMAESSAPAQGLYEGHVYLPATDRHEPQEVSCRVKGKNGGKGTAAGKVTVLDPAQSRVAVTNGHGTILKSADQGYTLFPGPGTRLEVIGRRGSLVHVRLGKDQDAWADQKPLTFLPAGAAPPRAVIGRAIGTRAGERSVRVTVSATERVAYEVRETVEPLGFEVRFFDAVQRFDRFHFGKDDDVVKDVRWSQESSDVVTLQVDTKLAWGWGYAAGYDEGGSFYLDIRRPPDLTKGDNVLAGRRVVLDPGHGPEASAVGPLGTTERDTNFAIAQALEELLKAQGAEVALTRHDVNGPPLGERPYVAQAAQGDLYVSIHNNALPANADPAEAPRGYMHFYYHPQSRPLAEAVWQAYRRRQPELADEGLRWGDLAVCRGPFMPAILTESAYMILPEQEERLRTPSYQKRLAGSLLEGIVDYLKEYQRLQKRSPEERAAARAK